MCVVQVLTDVMFTRKNLHARDMALIPGFAAEEMILVVVVTIVVIVLVIIVVIVLVIIVDLWSRVWTFVIGGIVIKEVLGGVIVIVLILWV